MITIKLINGEEVLLVFNNKTTKLVQAKYKGFDPFKSDDWMDDPEIIDYLGYQAASQGAVVEGKEFKYSLEQFGALLSAPNAIEIIKYFVKTFNEYAQYIIDNTKKKQEAGAT